MSVKVLAFDLFGTLFDLSTVDHRDLKAYADHIKKDEWEPLHFPKYWEYLTPFNLVKEGLEILKEKFFVVTFSNAPIEFQEKLLANAGLEFHSRIGVEYNHVFKPQPGAYIYLRTIMGGKGFKPDEIMVVTSNKDFGDLEGAEKAEMKSYYLKEHNLFRLYEDIVNVKQTVN